MNNFTEFSPSGLIPDDEFYMQNPGVKIVFIFSYACIFVVGVVANGVMLVVGLSNWLSAKQHEPSTPRQTATNMNINSTTTDVTNILVANLAAGDIVLCLFSAPSTPFSYYLPNWPLGEFMCRFLPSTLITAVCIISFTSTVLAVDRHLAICYPAKKRLNVRWAFVAIALIWFVSTMCSIPIFLTQKLALMQDEDGVITKQCRESWLDHDLQRAFSLSIMIAQFGIPFALIFYCYGSIFLVIRAQDSFRSKATSNQTLTIKKPARTNSLANNPSDGCFARCHLVTLMSDARFMRTTRILLSMISVFMACWLPINFMHVFLDYFADSSSNLWSTTRWYSLLYFSAHVLAMSSTLWNPLLYGWMNENFRKEVVRAFSFNTSIASDDRLKTQSSIKTLSPQQSQKLAIKSEESIEVQPILQNSARNVPEPYDDSDKTH